MESGLTIAKSKESRKVLDPNPNKIVENKINKLCAINSQHFTVYNGELEELLSLDYGKLLPDELLKIFEILTKNLYYNEKIFRLLFKAVLDKVVYFNIDELISLLTQINRISTFYSPSDIANSTSDGTELILNSPTNPKPDAQKVIKRVLEVLENKLKYKEEDFLGLNILKVVNKLTHFSCWNLLSYLSNSILNNIESNSSDTSNFSESLNVILDNCSLKIIDIICSNPQLTFGDNNSNSELFINKNLLLSYYSAGELSTLPLLINTVNHDQNSTGVSPLEWDILCRIINRIYKILIKSEQLYNIESNCLNSSLKIYFKLFYCIKFLNLSERELIYDTLFNRLEKHVIPKLNSLNSKNQCYLLLLLSQYVNNNTANLDSSTEQIIKAVRTINRNISNQLNLSILDKLTVLEGCYQKFGYVNHFTAKKFINSTLSQFPRNPIDSLVIQRTSSFSSKVFFNPFLKSPNNFKNDKFYCKFDINSVKTFGKVFSKGGILSRIRPFKCIPIYFYTCTT